MNLDRVTITGADDSINPAHLVDLSARYPWVEWGILFSSSQEDGHRFPSARWTQRLLEIHYQTPLKLSAHLCGRWVRDLVRGRPTWQDERPGVVEGFQRLQLNFHAHAHETKPQLLATGLSWLPMEIREVIFQFDDVNNALIEVALRVPAGPNGLLRAVPLFDLSGGAGILPAAWPKPVGDYSGYAGGLSPDNVVEQLGRIAEVAGDARIWIDVETHVRSDNDALFDLAKVERFLEAVAPFVVAERVAGKVAATTTLAGR